MIGNFRVWCVGWLAAVVPAVGCASAERDSGVQAAETSESGLAAAEYFGTAGETVFVQSAKLTPGTLTLAKVDSYVSGGVRCAKTVRVGSCLVQQGCEPSPAPVTLPVVHPVTITSGTNTINIPSQSSPFFDFRPNPLPPLVPPGAEVRATAGGIAGSVPAFELATTMPGAAIVTRPDYSKRVTIHRTAPFVAEWSGGDTFVDVRISSAAFEVVATPEGAGRGGRQVGDGGTVQCLFPARLGRGSVPAAALAYLPLGQGAPESVPLTAPIGTRYIGINLEIAAENHALEVSVNRKGPAIGELIARSSNDNTSDVEIVE